MLHYTFFQPGYRKGDPRCFQVTKLLANADDIDKMEKMTI